MRTLTHIVVLFFCLLEVFFVNPASAKQVDFGIVTVGTPKDLDVSYHTQGVTGITPAGCERGVRVDTITIEGADANDFKVVKDGLSGQTCLPGSTHTATVRFTPSKIGDEYARLNSDAHAVDPQCNASFTPCDLLGVSAKKPKKAGTPGDPTETGPQIGDVVIYRVGKTIVHSGVVSQTRADGKTVTKIISKWGTWGLYEHNPNDVPANYGTWTVYHSRRVGNHLRLSSGGVYTTDLSRIIPTFGDSGNWWSIFGQILDKGPGKGLEGAWWPWIKAGLNVTPRPDQCEAAMGSQLYSKLRVLGPPSLSYDCHGYTFTNKERWLGDTGQNEIDQIREDNGYKPVPALDTNDGQH